MTTVDEQLADSVITVDRTSTRQQPNPGGQQRSSIKMRGLSRDHAVMMPQPKCIFLFHRSIEVAGRSIGRALSNRRWFRDVMYGTVRPEARAVIIWKEAGAGSDSAIESRWERCWLRIHRLLEQHTWETAGLARRVFYSEGAASRERASGSGDRDLGVLGTVTGVDGAGEPWRDPIGK